MQARVRLIGLGMFCLALAAGAQDPGLEQGIRDDLTVRGQTGNKADPDFEAYGYAAFGTNYSAASFVTSGVGQVYIQNSLEVGSNIYARGAVVYPDGTSQVTAFDTNAVCTLASGECDTNRVDILFSANYAVSAVRVFQNSVTGQAVSVFLNGAAVSTFPLATASTSQTLSVSIAALDRLGILCTNVNGTVLFAFEGRRR